VSESGPADPGHADLDRVFREEHGRVVATLTRRLGDIDLAEEAAQEAYLIALQRWPETGLPPNPGAWLTTTAYNRAIDRIRRESTRDSRQAQAAMISDTSDDPGNPASSVVDDRLRLMFTCCHPSLATSAQVALTLRLLGGLSVAEIAGAFLVDEAAMAKRLTRSKQKIKAARIPYRVPSDAELPGRLRGVLATLFLVFNEGYLPSAPSGLPTENPGTPTEPGNSVPVSPVRVSPVRVSAEPVSPVRVSPVQVSAGSVGAAHGAIRTDLCAEAIRLTRILATLMPDEPEVLGLLALMLLTDARRASRVSGGSLVVLSDQDRSRWDQDLIAEGHDIVRGCLRRGRPGRYQILAAINAVHTDAASVHATDWRQVVALYDQLLAVDPSPIVALNRAIAIAEVDGPTAALEILDGLPLAGYHAYQATRADLLRRAGSPEAAASAYQRALDLTGNPAERAFLRGRLDELGAGPVRGG
jgi:RNA polymerase sigma-70 factor (ECF subfamily)